jgi:hypothetical protein
MSINDYFDAQRANLSISLGWEPFAAIFPLVDKLYVDAIGLTPSGPSSIFGQLLLICHKSFLSAAALIAQAQPEDAGPITRRAIEAARIAAMFKTDPAKGAEWMEDNRRLERWADRRDGKKPKPLFVEIGVLRPEIAPTIDELMRMSGVLSDVYAHFTPEFLDQLEWQKRDASMHLNYFTRDQRELKRAIVLTSGIHLRILDVIDWCLDGAFKLNPDWLKSQETLVERASPLAKEFERP